MPKTETPAPVLFDDPGVDRGPVGDALVLAQASLPVAVGQSPLDALANLEHGVEIAKRRAELMETVRSAALRMTVPTDWVRNKGKHDAEAEAVCMLKSPGALRIAPYYGIELGPVLPRDAAGRIAPIEETGETKEGGKEIRFTLYVHVHVKMTGEEFDVTAARSDQEKFIGRGGLETASPLTARGDLIQSVETLLRTKAVRVGAGMKGVAVSELSEAWKGTDKKISSIPKGSGFGTSAQRGAATVTSEGAKAEQVKLRDEILRRVGGNEDDAKAVLRDITLWKTKDGRDMWSTSTTQLTEEWKVKKAWDKLKAHEVFGDAPKDGG